MPFQEFFTHYPSRLLSVGMAVLGLFTTILGAAFFPILDQPHFPSPSRKTSKIEGSQPLLLLLSNDLKPHQYEFDISSIENRFLLSLCPKRPDDSSASAIAHVKIKGSNLTKQIPLPGKCGLLFNEQGDLIFQENDDRFWMEISLKEDGTLFSSLFVDCAGEVQKLSFSRQPTQPPLQKAEELSCSEPFQLLGAARWVGVDLVAQLDAGHLAEQKIEIGVSKIDLSEGESVFWDGSRWVKAFSIEEGRGKPLAKIRAVSSQSLEWDAWDSSGQFHVRFATALHNAGAPRVKIEECFSSIRIRSDKQISCLLEKQCLILREGDWILKENGRWRVLRKPEERRYLVHGNRSGDLIVLGAIDTKRKTIQGQFIFSNRVQGFPIELTATSSKLERKAATALQSDRSLRLGRAP